MWVVGGREVVWAGRGVPSGEEGCAQWGGGVCPVGRRGVPSGEEGCAQWGGGVCPVGGRGVPSGQGGVCPVLFQ